ncbi:hypothetical protein GTW66_13940 [Streptomyces sp. SID5473]|uniref:Uncharacterized protein n=2 Tax=Streptomyces TaxID=1883 RepID=I2MT21_STRT9|nr:hypothetical protein B7R87_32985 [Streptomyces tsukubensis]EIF87918.1 hypothetical protein [Streptomyces tsukubensis NRRL18488]MYS65130.1 hypothetical protein [Streptomyces sp. SID5473]QKM65775.1 hypothetical protein STSU_000015 [Streptomyces tsukubensis NRRL18488]
MVAMPKQFVIAVEEDDRTRLNAVVKAAFNEEEKWLEETRDREGLQFLRGRAASMARVRIREEQARLRAQGVLRGSKALVLAPGVRAELKARGMAKRFASVPAGEAGASGRRVGAGPRHYGRLSEEDKSTLTGRVAVELPDELGDQLVRACYWTSQPAVEALWEWQKRWGDGPEVKLREAQRAGLPSGFLALFTAGLATPATADALLEKSVLQGQIVTTGDIIRAAIHRAI